MMLTYLKLVTGRTPKMLPTAQLGRRYLAHASDLQYVPEVRFPNPLSLIPLTGSVVQWFAIRNQA